MKPDIVELVAGILDISRDRLTMESGPKTVSEWDSLAHITIAAAVEQTYHIELTMPEILSIHSVADLLEVLQRHGVAVSVSGKSD